MINSEIYYKYLQKKYSRSISLGLSRVKKALRLLNSPHLKLKKPVNVIGSDGKFTCIKALQNFIESNGNTTTANCSPHLFDLRTRFWLKNRFISLKEIKKYEKKISKLKVKLSLFEVLTLIHILAASKENADFSLQESGLLFRGDASRVWDKPFMQVCTGGNSRFILLIFTASPISVFSRSNSRLLGMLLALQLNSTNLRTRFSTPPFFKPGQIS